ncbi:hypothetical protein BH09ACT8_BH09ACT8_22590 [soil metagenome]
MNYTRAAVAVSAGLMAALLAGGAAFAAPAQADPINTDFLNTLTDSGLTGLDPVNATSVGESVCPMLAQPGQNLADVASSVSDSIGRPLGPATMFTGLAISMFCPAAVSSLANGDNPLGGLPLNLLGGF